MKHKKPFLSNNFCYAFPVHEPISIPAPSPQPSPKKVDPPIPIDCCGNIFIQENQTTPIELWSIAANLIALTTVTIYNSTNSSEPLKVEITSKNKFILTVVPGNTSSYTTNYIQSVKTLTIANPLTFIEGKYTVVGTILEEKNII
ncbi:S-Ena type endospore appendage [Bacillus sp. EAC]|uniref:S-Ena type endospore appendage n=1 Tax=Bacillus sp. EAC TaxID=1978338 RepID=UPI000B4469AA|nr:S-Ena type endospore appendage [Bacillus sp. EAC]